MSTVGSADEYLQIVQVATVAPAVRSIAVAMPAPARPISARIDLAWLDAVGPFQFIPQTWRTWGADGDGDGRADPNQIADAALAAALTPARCLCYAGNLSTAEGWRQAVFSYNQLDSYVNDVARVANLYRSWSNRLSRNPG
jgi:hypothetical protein